jgi:hypothetical protein
VGTTGANQCWREAAAIEKHQHLAVSLQVLIDNGGEWLAYAVDHRSAAQVYEPEIRWPGAARAFGKLNACVIASEAMLQQLKRWRRGTQYHRDIVMLGAGDSEIASRVTQALLLLERMIVLFVHDNQAEIWHRRKYSGTSTDDELRASGACTTPGSQSICITKTGVQHGWSDAKARLQTGDELWCEADLRHENEYLLASVDDVSHELQIDFRFTTACDAVEHEYVEATPIANRIQGMLLMFIQRGPGLAGGDVR